MAFKNLKIVFHLENSICIERNKGAFDAILAMLYFNQLKHEGTFDGNYEMPLPFLDMTDGVYHTSFPIIEGESIYYDKEQLVKKFDHELYAKHGEIVSKNGKPRGLVETAQGPYKNAFFSLERISADTVTYYCRGDKDTIVSLLKKMHFLGKKSSLGWGKINRMNVDETEEDFSILKDGKLMRNLPVENSFGVTSSENVALFRLTHPYWKKQSMAPCLMP